MDRDKRLAQINENKEIKAGFYQKDNKLVYVQANGDYFDVDFDKLKEKAKESSRLKEILSGLKVRMFDLEAKNKKLDAQADEMIDGQKKASFALTTEELEALADEDELDELEERVVGDPYNEGEGEEEYDPEKATEQRKKARGNKNIFDLEDWELERDNEPFFLVGKTQDFTPDKQGKDSRRFVVKKAKQDYKDTLEGKIVKDLNDTKIIGSVEVGYNYLDPTDYFADKRTEDFIRTHSAADVLKKAQAKFKADFVNMGIKKRK